MDQNYKCFWEHKIYVSIKKEMSIPNVFMFVVLHQSQSNLYERGL